MITYSGRSVWPKNTLENGVPTDIGPSIEDIAVGLGRQSRFAGQTREFYTVLCHSLVCWQAAYELWPEDYGVRRVLLLHDGHESTISDVPTTWKNELTRADEAELDRRIWAEFDLPEIKPGYDLAARVKRVDAAALAAEAHVLGHAEAEKWWSMDRFGALEHRIMDLTQAQLTAGNPVRYLNPDNAITAMNRALQR